MGIKISEKQRELVESFGVVQEGMGLAPASARVNALLTISDVPELSFEEIQETLQLSKGATSNAINNLITLEQIGYKTKPGDRKRYFYSKLDQWKVKFRKDILGLKPYNDLLNEILENRTDVTKQYNEKIKELIEFMEYFVEESVKLIDEWKQPNK